MAAPEPRKDPPADPGGQTAAGAAVAFKDRVPVRQKIAYGFGSAVDVWGHWLYPTLAFPGILLFGWLARRERKPTAMKLALFTSCLAFAGTWWFYDPRIPWLQLFATASFSFSAAAFWTLLGSINADVMDYDELETGKRREGAFASCSSWIMKFGLAAGAGTCGLLLSATGFNAGLEGAQAPHALLWIRLLVAGVPLTGFVIAALALMRFPLTQVRMREIRQRLEPRRGVI